MPLLNIAIYLSVVSLFIVCICTFPNVDVLIAVTNWEPLRFVNPCTGLLFALSCKSAWSACFVASAACDIPLNKVGIALYTSPIVT